MGRYRANILAAAGILLLASTPSQAQSNFPGQAPIGHITLPPSRPPTGLPFPEVRDWRTLRIKLDWGPCYGSCPIYSVQIDGDGTVRYNGGGYTAVKGKDIAHINVTAVRELVVAFQKAEFYRLFPEYAEPVTDAATYTVEIAFDGQGRKVVDYRGMQVGMPKDVHDLEEKIDLVAGTARWVDGNDETVAILKAKNWNFRAASYDNEFLLKIASASGSSKFLDQLLAEGIAVRNAAGCEAVTAAVESRDKKMIESLIAAGAPLLAIEVRNCDAVWMAAQMGDPEILKIMLPRASFRGQRREQSSSVLHAAVMGWANPKLKGDYPATIKLLLSAGANPNVVNSEGLTPQSLAIKIKLDPAKRAILSELLSNPK